MQEEAGFTLMELMISIAIIGILAASVTPSVMQWLANRRLAAGTQNILSALNGAKLCAVRENIHTVIAFDVRHDSYRVFLDFNHNNAYDKDTDRSLDSEKMPAGISITDAAFAGGAPRIRFDGEGLPKGFGGHVVLSDSRGDTCQVVINATGNIRVAG